MNRASRDHKFGARCEIPAYTYARTHRDGAEGGEKEGEEEGEREKETRWPAHTHIHTHVHTYKEGEHINSLGGIRIGPFQTSAGWRGGKGVV